MTLNKLAFSISLGLGLLGNGCTHIASHGSATSTIKIVAFNDFHGQLESPGNLPQAPASPSSGEIPVGGVDWMAGYIAALKDQNPNTIVVSAGDVIGATPLISALFHDEGTIETMNRLGLDFSAIGNHEFDEGQDELLRMQNGGCHPTDANSCRGVEVGTPVPFEGARFKFLAGNVMASASGNTLFPAYAIKTLGGMKIAFIGMTLKETPNVVTPNAVQGLAFLDEAETANALIPEIRAKGVEAIVVLIHQGGTVPVPQSVATINRCDGGLNGSPIKAIVNRLDDEVDLVISGHTHMAYNCQLANSQGRLISVTSAYAQGRVLTDIDVHVDKTSGEVSDALANNIVVDRRNTSIVPDAAMRLLVDRYKAISEPIANRVIGSVSADITNSIHIAGESKLGDMIADAQLAATAVAGGAVAAFTNPDGIRANLNYASSSVGEGDGKVTYGEAFTVQPFDNNLVTMSLTGAQIHTLLEQQFSGCREGYPSDAPAGGQPFDRILQVSEGFSYRWREKGTTCDNVDPASIEINGVRIEPSALYRITVNSFLAEGGDQFYVLKKGTDRQGGPLDLDALIAYFAAHPVVSPVLRKRISLIP
ncbi:MAG: bifunctional metallophosphatase/5'-nucleotidase [Methylomonas sp.]